MSEKKKETKQKMGWATAQLCHNTMGNCIVTQQVLEGWFGWGKAVSRYKFCIVTEAACMAGEVCVAIHQVYCDRSRDLAGGSCVTIQEIVL